MKHHYIKANIIAGMDFKPGVYLFAPEIEGQFIPPRPLSHIADPRRWGVMNQGGDFWSEDGVSVTRYYRAQSESVAEALRSEGFLGAQSALIPTKQPWEFSDPRMTLMWQCGEKKPSLLDRLNAYSDRHPYALVIFAFCAILAGWVATAIINVYVK